MKYSQRPKYERRNETIAVLVMILLCIPVLFIYFSFFANAFILDSTGELTLQNFQFLYQPIQLSQYTVEPIGKAFRNTVIFTAIATTLEVTISCMAGYALARMEFTGKRVISFSLLTLRLFPGVLLLIGVLYVLLHLGILNTLTGVIVVAIALRLPGSTFIIRNFFAGIPQDIENSALVDGCNRLTAFFQVIIHRKESSPDHPVRKRKLNYRIADQKDNRRSHKNLIENQWISVTVSHSQSQSNQRTGQKPRNQRTILKKLIQFVLGFLYEANTNNGNQCRRQCRSNGIYNTYYIWFDCIQRSKQFLIIFKGK